MSLRSIVWSLIELRTESMLIVRYLNELRASKEFVRKN